MRNKAFNPLVFIAFVACLGLAWFVMKGGASRTSFNSGEAMPVMIQDMVGRSVSLPLEPERVVAIGPGALRLFIYGADAHALAGVEKLEKNIKGRPYAMANPALQSLPIIGPGGPNNAPDPEQLIALNPQIIFSTYATSPSVADELQRKTRIPVVVLSYGAGGVFGREVKKAILLVGRIMGTQKKAEAAVAFIDACAKDLEERTGHIPEQEKKNVYVGALGNRGTHGIESTQGRYSLLEAIHARNVVDATGRAGALMIDKEKLIEWAPDYIFIDYNGYNAVLSDFQQRPAFYRSLKAFQQDRVYAQLPYNFYSTNIDTAMANAYYLGCTLYPKAFSGIDPAQKADEIYQALLGVKLYGRMRDDFGGFGKLKF